MIWLYVLTAVALGALTATQNRADSGTPVATPVAESDATGAARCDAEPLPEVRPIPIVEGAPAPPPDLSGPTPAASVVPLNRVQLFGQPPGISWDDLPTGEPAGADVVAEIEATIAQMNACARLGLNNHLAAYYSADFYLRPWVRWQVRYNGYWNWAPGTMGVGLGDFEQASVRPDGRVAVVYQYVAFHQRGSGPATPLQHGYLVVFAERDGRWLVDEFAEISPFGQGVG